jgi:hypothetical protein
VENKYEENKKRKRKRRRKKRISDFQRNKKKYLDYSKEKATAAATQPMSAREEPCTASKEHG